MIALFNYILQVILIAGVLYAYYHIALRNKRFHRYNRFYLLSATVFSIIIPLVNIPVYFTKKETAPYLIPEATSVSSAHLPDESFTAGPDIAATGNWFTLQNVLLIVYLLIAAIILLRVIVSLVKIKRIADQNPVERIGDIQFVSTDEPGTPFSFFRWLFWDRAIELNSVKGQQVFRHELFHIRQKHSFDVLYMEMLTVLFWFNPFFYLIKKEQKAIHEFLADQFAAPGNHRWEYAELLLMQALRTRQQLVNPFFHTQIKRRIAMITNPVKSRYTYASKLLALPIIAVLTALFAFSYKSKPVTILSGKPITVVIDAGHSSKSGTVAPDGTYEGAITLELAKRIKALNRNERINILLTRETDADIALKKRTEFAKTQQADLFISLHLNEAAAASKNGFEVCVSKKNNRHTAENRIFGSILLNYLSGIYQTTNSLQELKESVWVLDQADYPSVLIECGYLSNKNDLAYVKDLSNQDKIASTILKAIEQFSLQEELPGFTQKKTGVTDTAAPPLKLVQDANGTVTATINDRKVTGITVNAKNEILLFMMENNAVVKLSSRTIAEARLKYKSLWTAFNNSASKTVVNEKDLVPGEDIVFFKVEIEPAFPGGNTAWKKYLEANLNGNVGTQHKAPAGQYHVSVKFIVDKDGSVRDFTPLTKYGFGMEEELIALLKQGPKWKPAIQNGRVVNAYMERSVSFLVP